MLYYPGDTTSVIDGRTKDVFCRDKILFVATKHFCPDKTCRDKTRLLSRQKQACLDETFVATKLCLSQQNIFVVNIFLSFFFVATNTCLLRQKNKVIFFRDKHTFVAKKTPKTKRRVCREKSRLVATKHFSLQNYVYRDRSVSFFMRHRPCQRCKYTTSVDN